MNEVSLLSTVAIPDDIFGRLRSCKGFAVCIQCECESWRTSAIRWLTLHQTASIAWCYEIESGKVRYSRRPIRRGSLYPARLEVRRLIAGVESGECLILCRDQLKWEKSVHLQNHVKCIRSLIHRTARCGKSVALWVEGKSSSIFRRLGRR